MNFVSNMHLRQGTPVSKGLGVMNVVLETVWGGCVTETHTKDRGGRGGADGSRED